MTEQFAEFAVPSGSIEPVAAALSERFGCDFEAHESSYWGPYLLHGDTNELHIRIRLNKDPMWQWGDPEDEIWFRPSYPSHGVLVDIRRPSDEVSAVASCLIRAFPGTQEVIRESAP